MDTRTGDGDDGQAGQADGSTVLLLGEDYFHYQSIRSFDFSRCDRCRLKSSALLGDVSPTLLGHRDNPK